MSRESRLSFKNQGALPQTLQALVRSELCFAKWLRHRIIFRTLLRKAVFDRPVFFGVHTLRFTGQSILLCKTVYCQNFATQNRLFRTLLRKAVCDRRIMVKAFCYAKRSSTAPFFFGVHTLRFIVLIQTLITYFYEIGLGKN